MSWKSTHTQPQKLQKEFTFDSFADALKFVNAVGEVAEAQNHHPDILMHDYKKVTITAYSHDAGEITEKDHALTEEIDQL